MIQVARENALSIEEFRTVLVESTLGERRPVEEPARLGKMLAHANLVVTARDESGRLVGVARSLTDFAYCCYLSDLAVSRELQKQGIGRRLIEETLRHLEPGAKLILLAAPAAVDYYARVGFEKHPSAWTRGA
ncbi:MAG: family N-acetyltransferase [Acidobacteria bacterium]|nr:family N-acetyltransferase [Acidobacteriota bacterium]